MTIPDRRASLASGDKPQAIRTQEFTINCNDKYYQLEFYIGFNNFLVIFLYLRPGKDLALGNVVKEGRKELVGETKQVLIKIALRFGLGLLNTFQETQIYHVELGRGWRFNNSMMSGIKICNQCNTSLQTQAFDSVKVVLYNINHRNKFITNLQ